MMMHTIRHKPSSIRIGDIITAMRAPFDHEAAQHTASTNHTSAVRNALAAIQARWDADHLRSVANEYRAALSLIAEGRDPEIMRLVAQTALLTEGE